MALTYTNAKKKLEQKTLSKFELEIIDKIEAYIDETIDRVFDNNSVKIELSIAKFEYMPGDDYHLNIKNSRKKIMREELEKRYINAGWQISVEIDDGLDGPNMSGPDYWVLTGKTT